MYWLYIIVIELFEGGIVSEYLSIWYCIAIVITHMYSSWNISCNCDYFFYGSSHSVTLLVVMLLIYLSTCILIINYCSTIPHLSYFTITRRQRKQDFHSLVFVLSISHEILDISRFCLKFSIGYFGWGIHWYKFQKKFFFTDDIEIFGLSGPCDNVEDNTFSKGFLSPWHYQRGFSALTVLSVYNWRKEHE